MGTATWCGQVNPPHAPSFGPKSPPRIQILACLSSRQWQNCPISFYPPLLAHIILAWSCVLGASSFTWLCLLRQEGPEQRHCVPPWANLCHLTSPRPGCSGRCPWRWLSRVPGSREQEVPRCWVMVCLQSAPTPGDSGPYSVAETVRLGQDWREGTPLLCPSGRKTSLPSAGIRLGSLVQRWALNLFPAEGTAC